MLQTEAQAMLKGMSEAHNRGFTRFQLLSDSAELVGAIESHLQPFEISTLVHDINAMRSKFSDCIIRKVNQLEVAPAHVVAVSARIGKI